jgi:hypothetical protein
MKRLIAITLVAAGLHLAAPAAPAEAAWSQCTAGYFCVWTGANGSGSFAKFQVGSADLRDPIGGVVFDNKITSVWNRQGDVFCAWSGYGYTGSKIGINGAERFANLGDTMDNNISSLHTDCSLG